MTTTAPRKLQEWASEADSQARIDKIKTKEAKSTSLFTNAKDEILTNDDAENIYSAEYKRREKIFDGLLRLVYPRGHRESLVHKQN